MVNRSCIVLLSSLFVAAAGAQVIQPAALRVAGNSYQVIYQGKPRDGQVSALLQNASGRQGSAMFLLGSASTRATLYFQNGSNYLCTLTRSATNIAYLASPPEMRSRILGVLSVCIGSGPIGFVGIGMLAEVVGASWAIVATGIAGLACMAVSWRYWRKI